MTTQIDLLAPEACSCGQTLDCCHGEHSAYCPRCGVRLVPRPETRAA